VSLANACSVVLWFRKWSTAEMVPGARRFSPPQRLQSTVGAWSGWNPAGIGKTPRHLQQRTLDAVEGRGQG
jgi:hypothetical protein